MAHVFLLIFLFSCIISTTNIHACNQTERTSLMAFAHTLSSPLVNWSSSVDCCCRNGITCNHEGWVTHLILSSKGLKGDMFVSSLGNLTHLIHLNLSHNSLYGALETKFLNQLNTLDLSYNLLSGELPFFPAPKNIQTIYLSSNQFHGTIPSSFFQQAWDLTSFNVSNNTFSGYIPLSICLLSSPSIRVLDFSSNEFSGNIFCGLGGCSKLQILRVGHNNLSRSIPEDIYNATKLEELALPLNSLNGANSERITNLTNLTILDLYFNHLSGVIPLNFRKLSKLKFMNFGFNSLEGNLPLSLMNCTNLLEIHLGFNYLEGDLTTPNFSKLSHLSKLDLIRNNFTGILPISLYSCRSLKAIRLSNNPYLQGQMQPEIFSLKSLSFLSLGHVQLTNITRAMKILMGCKSLHTLLLSNSFDREAMPTDGDMVDFHGFQNLRVLSLAYCGLTGQIPGWLSKLKKLETLFLNHNRITGSIPSWLGTLPKLFHAVLSNNKISGEFPKQLCRFPILMVNASRVDNYEFELPILSGPMENPLYWPRRAFNLLGTIDITGSIPTEIGQLQLLQMLCLDYNNFSGDIPNQISNLKYLEILGLSKNHLSGKIPWSMTSLSFMKQFDVSYNNLQGEIPRGTQLQTFNASAFEGNPKLCGVLLPNECREIDADNKNNVDQDANNKCNELPRFYIFAALGFIVGFWGVCGSLVLNRTWRYVYFQFLDNIQDSLYVKMAVCVAKMKRRNRD